MSGCNGCCKQPKQPQDCFTNEGGIWTRGRYKSRQHVLIDMHMLEVDPPKCSGHPPSQTLTVLQSFRCSLYQVWQCILLVHLLSQKTARMQWRLGHGIGLRQAKRIKLFIHCFAKMSDQPSMLVFWQTLLSSRL